MKSHRPAVQAATQLLRQTLPYDAKGILGQAEPHRKTPLQAAGGRCVLHTQGLHGVKILLEKSVVGYRQAVSFRLALRSGKLPGEVLALRLKTRRQCAFFLQKILFGDLLPPQRPAR